MDRLGIHARTFATAEASIDVSGFASVLLAVFVALVIIPAILLGMVVVPTRPQHHIPGLSDEEDEHDQNKAGLRTNNPHSDKFLDQYSDEITRAMRAELLVERVPSKAWGNLINGQPIAQGSALSLGSAVGGTSPEIEDSGHLALGPNAVRNGTQKNMAQRSQPPPQLSQPTDPRSLAEAISNLASAGPSKRDLLSGGGRTTQRSLMAAVSDAKKAAALGDEKAALAVAIEQAVLSASRRQLLRRRTFTRRDLSHQVSSVSGLTIIDEQNPEVELDPAKAIKVAVERAVMVAKRRMSLRKRTGSRKNMWSRTNSALSRLGSEEDDEDDLGDTMGESDDAKKAIREAVERAVKGATRRLSLRRRSASRKNIWSRTASSINYQAEDQENDVDLDEVFQDPLKVRDTVEKAVKLAKRRLSLRSRSPSRKNIWSRTASTVSYREEDAENTVDGDEEDEDGLQDLEVPDLDDESVYGHLAGGLSKRSMRKLAINANGMHMSSFTSPSKTPTTASTGVSQRTLAAASPQPQQQAIVHLHINAVADDTMSLPGSINSSASNLPIPQPDMRRANSTPTQLPEPESPRAAAAAVKPQAPAAPATPPSVMATRQSAPPRGMMPTAPHGMIPGTGKQVIAPGQGFAGKPPTIDIPAARPGARGSPPRHTPPAAVASFGSEGGYGMGTPVRAKVVQVSRHGLMAGQAAADPNALKDAPGATATTVTPKPKPTAVRSRIMTVSQANLGTAIGFDGTPTNPSSPTMRSPNPSDKELSPTSRTMQRHRLEQLRIMEDEDEQQSSDSETEQEAKLRRQRAEEARREEAKKQQAAELAAMYATSAANAAAIKMGMVQHESPAAVAAAKAEMLSQRRPTLNKLAPVPAASLSSKALAVAHLHPTADSTLASYGSQPPPRGGVAKQESVLSHDDLLDEMEQIRSHPPSQYSGAQQDDDDDDGSADESESEPEEYRPPPQQRFKAAEKKPESKPAKKKEPAQPRRFNPGSDFSDFESGSESAVATARRSARPSMGRADTFNAKRGPTRTPGMGPGNLNFNRSPPQEPQQEKPMYPLHITDTGLTALRKTMPELRNQVPGLLNTKSQAALRARQNGGFD